MVESLKKTKKIINIRTNPKRENRNHTIFYASQQVQFQIMYFIISGNTSTWAFVGGFCFAGVAICNTNRSNSLKSTKETNQIRNLILVKF